VTGEAQDGFRAVVQPPGQCSWPDPKVELNGRRPCNGGRPAAVIDRLRTYVDVGASVGVSTGAAPPSQSVWRGAASLRAPYRTNAAAGPTIWLPVWATSALNIACLAVISPRCHRALGTAKTGTKADRSLPELAVQRLSDLGGAVPQGSTLEVR
jgi:hypothetical protein